MSWLKPRGHRCLGDDMASVLCGVRVLGLVMLLMLSAEVSLLELGNLFFENCGRNPLEFSRCLLTAGVFLILGWVLCYVVRPRLGELVAAVVILQIVLVVYFGVVFGGTEVVVLTSCTILPMAIAIVGWWRWNAEARRENV